MPQPHTKVGRKVADNFEDLTYRVLVTGSQTWPKPSLVHLALSFAYAEAVSLSRRMILVQGACPDGADSHSVDWFNEMVGLGFPISIESYPANWTAFGRSAGYRRNAEMVKLTADQCLAFIHNESNGSSHTAGLAEAAGIPTLRFVL